MGILSGIKVVDVTRGLAGPFATHALSDYGADMLRIDEPGAERSQFDLAHLRGRRSIAIDLTVEDGLQVARKLIDGADILLTEPGLDGRPPLPWDYASLSGTNPELISCRITGFGDDGPMVDSWANDRLVAARYGVHNQPGWRPGPTFLVAPIPSLGAGFLAVQGIGVALYQREKTGRGQDVMVSLLAGALCFQPGTANASQGPLMNYPGLVGRTPLGQAPFYSIYQCGDGEWIHLGCLMPYFQDRAMEALEVREEIMALGFRTPEANKQENHDAIIAAIGAKLKAKPFAHWDEMFEVFDIPHARSQWTEELLDDAQIAAEGLAVEFDDPTAGPLTQLSTHVLTNSGDWEQPRPAPSAGQHTDEVLREAGISESEIAALRTKGVVA